jgi:hypothetical protein
MNQSKKQLTAEEISRAREKTQKKRDRKKQAGVRAKDEAISARLGIASTHDTKKEDFKPKDKADGERAPTESLSYVGPDGEWLSTESPPCLNVEDLNIGWPWLGAPSVLLTQAPYAVNEYNFDAGFFALPQEVQVT